MTIEKAINEFILEQQIRGNSPQTIKYYRVVLYYFVLFLGADFKVRKLTINDFNDYVLFLLQRDNLKHVSIRTYSRGVKVFLKWLSEKGYISDFIAKIRLVRAEKSVVLPLSDDEVKTLISEFDNSYLGIRNKCIVLLMLDCGLRRGEVVNLCCSDLFFDRNIMLVNGKGSKQRIVPIGVKTKEYLRHYLNIRESPYNSFFTAPNGEPITGNTIKMMFQRLKVSSGIKRVHPHLLRHTFATFYIVDGGNLEELRIIMGHSDIMTTQIYLHLAFNYNLSIKNHRSHFDKIVL